MKCIYLLLVSVIALIACNEIKTVKNESKTISETVVNNLSQNSPKPYITLDIDKLNQKLSSLKPESLTEIAKVYYNPVISGEGNESLDIFEEEKRHPKRVSIIHNNIPDDSIRGIKYTLVMNEEGSMVSEIRKSFRCWPGRGSGSWHGEGCQ